MKKIYLFIICFIILFQVVNAKDLTKDIIISNRLFSITLPNDFKNQIKIKKDKRTISIFHKDSAKKGFGGFAFALRVYKNPSEHAMLPGGKKIGEFKDARGNLYDMVLKYPTDVQYDYVKYSKKPPEDFLKIYNYGENVEIKAKGKNQYFKNQGTKGENLYKEILEKHAKAIKEKWSSKKLEEENMSYMYSHTKNIGYAFFDANADGIEELFIGENTKDKQKSVIYDIYTMVDRKPKHVISGGNRNRFFVCDYSFICNEYNQGALENGVRVYNLVENSTELFPQLAFKYDGYENKKNPWFVSYDFENDKWENVDKKKYDERKEVFNKYERFDFKPINLIEIKTLEDRYNLKKDYFDYSVVLNEFPKDYYYTTIKINKSKERILIITDKVELNNNTSHGLFYYFKPNGFVYPLGYLESETPFSQSKNYLYMNNQNENIKFYISDKKFEIIKSQAKKLEKDLKNIEFDTIESAQKFDGDFGSPAGDDIKEVKIDGFYFEYHKPQYKKEYIKSLVQQCINDGVKTQVQMYCCVVKKLHP